MDPPPSPRRRRRERVHDTGGERPPQPEGVAERDDEVADPQGVGVGQGGRIPRAYLGVGTQHVVLPEPVRERMSVAQRTAVIVMNVKSGSPAAAAGLIIGDVIISIAGHAIAEPEDLVAVLQPDRVGGAVTVSILRGGEPRELQVTVGEHPSRA